MTKFLVNSLLTILLAASAFAQEFSLSQFLNVQSATRPTISPTGREVAYISSISGEPQVWRMHDRPSAPRQTTFESEGVDGVWWSPVNPTHMIVAASLGGSEKSKLFLINPGYTPLIPITPVDDNAIYRFGSWSPDGSMLCYASNSRNGTDFDIFEHQLLEPEARVIYDGGGHMTAVAYSHDNRFLLMVRDHSNVNSDLLIYDRETNTTRLLTEHSGDERYESPHFDHSGANIIVLTNREREYVGVASYNLESAEWTWLETPDADIDMLAVAPDGSGYGYVVNDRGMSRFHYKDIAKDRRVDGYRFPNGIIRNMTFSSDSKRMAISFGTATKPFDIWLYEPLPDLLVRLTESATGGVPTELFVAPELIEYETFDKRKIPAFFYKPQNVTSKTPVIISIHGGPESQARPDLSGLYQYWLYKGYAILEPNVRGSAGFGRSYLALDNVRKRMDSVKDIEYAAKWLSKRKEIDKDKIILQGGSYGGFMVLAGLTTYPDLFAAGIDVVGISNFVSFLENTGDYRRALREAEYGSLATDREFLQEISPLNHADKIKAPLFVIQGANDPRVPQSEADQIVESIQSRGGIVEYLLYPDEGHGLRKTENKLDAYSKVVKFLEKYVPMNN